LRDVTYLKKRNQKREPRVGDFTSGIRRTERALFHKKINVDEREKGRAEATKSSQETGKKGGLILIENCQKKRHKQQ